MREKLKRDIAREELTRIEEAARTEEDLKAVGKRWDKLDANAERKKRHYMADLQEMTIEDIEVTDGVIIPQPLDHKW